MIDNGKANSQIIYQNGNIKSDAAVIDIIEDGKYIQSNFPRTYL